MHLSEAPSEGPNVVLGVLWYVFVVQVLTLYRNLRCRFRANQMLPGDPSPHPARPDEHQDEASVFEGSGFRAQGKGIKV